MLFEPELVVRGSTGPAPSRLTRPASLERDSVDIRRISVKFLHSFVGYATLPSRRRRGRDVSGQQDSTSDDDVAGPALAGAPRRPLAGPRPTAASRTAAPTTRPGGGSAVIYQVYVRELRRRRRRRHRRPRRRPRPAALPARPRASTPSGSRPWYLSPLADGGYDVADYRAIDPAFGTLAEAEALIAEALDLGIRTIIDVVPNHVSDRHPWFQAALAAGPGSPERERFWFRPGRGDDGDEPPNDWPSEFGGPAVDPDDEPRRHARRVVPAPVHPRAARPQLGPPRRPRGARGRSCGSGSTAAPAASASTRPRCWSRTRRCPSPGRPGAGRPPVHRPRRAPRHLPLAGARSPTRYPGTRVLRRRGLAARHRALRPLPAPRRAAHRLQLRLPGPPVGRRRACATRSTRPSPPTRRSARPPPGSCPTTT